MRQARFKWFLSLTIVIVGILCDQSYSQTRRGGWDPEGGALPSESTSPSSLANLCIRAYGPPDGNPIELDRCIQKSLEIPPVCDLNQHDPSENEPTRFGCTSETPPTLAN